MNKSKILLRLSLALVLVIGAFSCGRVDTSHASIIPQDAHFVAELHLQDLYDKADINPDDKLFKEYINEPGDTARDKFFKSIIEDPSKLGISYSDPVFLFRSPSLGMGFVAKVKSESKLLAAIEEVAPAPPTQGNGYQYVYDSSGGVIVFNADKLFVGKLTTDSDLEATLTELMTRTTEASVLATGQMRKMMEAQGDAKTFVSLHSVLELNERAQSGSSVADSMVLALASQLDKTFYTLALDFAEGKAKLTTSLYSENEQYIKALELQREATMKPSGEFLKYFPEKSVFITATGIDGAKVIAGTRQMGYLAPIEELLKEVNLDIIAAIESLQGDITLGAYPPSVVAYLSLRDEAPLRRLVLALGDSIKAQTPETAPVAEVVAVTPDSVASTEAPALGTPTFADLGEGNYRFGNGWGTEIYIGFKDKKCYIAFSEEAASRAWTPVAAGDKDISSQPVASELLQYPSMMLYNHQAALVSLTPFFSFLPKPVYDQIERISHLSVYGDNQALTMELVFTDNGDNSLKQLIGIISAVAKEI